MGNTIANNTIIEIKNIISDIMKIDYNILDIGNKNGSTDYLDFISLDDVKNNNIMKGIDNYERYFIVIKAFYEYPTQNKNTFTTFFQRHSENQTLWIACGQNLDVYSWWNEINSIYNIK